MSHARATQVGQLQCRLGAEPLSLQALAMRSAVAACAAGALTRLLGSGRIQIRWADCLEALRGWAAKGGRPIARIAAPHKHTAYEDSVATAGRKSKRKDHHIEQREPADRQRTLRKTQAKGLGAFLASHLPLGTLATALCLLGSALPVHSVGGLAPAPARPAARAGHRPPGPVPVKARGAL